MKTIRVQLTDQAYSALMKCVPNYGTSPSAIVQGLVECMCDPISAKIQFEIKQEIRDALLSLTLERTASVLEQIQANTIAPVHMTKPKT